MFVRIGICGDIAVDDLVAGALPPELVRRRKIARLRQDIVENGIAVFGSAAERDAFMEALPDIEAQRWSETVLADGRHRELSARELCACQQPSLTALRSDWKPHADAVVCTTAKAVVDFGLTPDIHPITDDGDRPEVAGLSAVDALSTIAAARQLACRRVIGELREDVWKARLQPAAHGCRELTVLDSFVVHQAARQLASGRVDSPASPLTGLSWLLRRAMTVADGQLKVRIYTRIRPTSEFTADELSTAVRQLFHRGLLTEFAWVQIWDWAPRRAAANPNTRMHQRVVQFGPCAVRLGNGTALFNDQRVTVDEACEPYRPETYSLFSAIEKAATARWEWRCVKTDEWVRTTRAGSGVLAHPEVLAVLDARGRAV
jgi:hypothetical protein